MKKQPNFFIIGAPKCGTTSLAFYLNEHENIFICDPKEPCFWSDETRESKNYSGFGIVDIDEYEQLFSNVPKKVSAIGDASTTYLWSESAVRKIFEFNPNSKFIVMLRNSVDLVYSLYLEELYALNESENDFSKAWQLQSERLLGNDIPSSCSSPLKLQYKHIASNGKHLKKIYEFVDKKNIKVIFLDDFSKNECEIYSQILFFLGVEQDDRRDFPVINASKKHAYPRLMKLILRPPAIFSKPVNLARKLAWSVGLNGIRSGFAKKLTENNKKKEMSKEMRKLLVQEFEDDIKLLSEVTGRDLSHWVEL